MKSSAVPDIKKTLEAFLILAYRDVIATGHTKPVPLEEIAASEDRGAEGGRPPEGTLR